MERESEDESKGTGNASPDYPKHVKREAIRRALSGEDIDAVAAELSVPAAELEDWVGKFLLARSGRQQTVPWEKKRKRRFRQYRDKTRSELDYPEMFEEIPRGYLRKLSPQRAKELMEKQAKSREKVGYERYTRKYFLPLEEDPYPEDRLELPERIRIDYRKFALFASGLLGGLAIYAGIVAAGVSVEKLGWMPAVLLGVLALAVLAGLISPE